MRFILGWPRRGFWTNFVFEYWGTNATGPTFRERDARLRFYKNDGPASPRTLTCPTPGPCSMTAERSP